MLLGAIDGGPAANTLGLLSRNVSPNWQSTSWQRLTEWLGHIRWNNENAQISVGLLLHVSYPYPPHTHTHTLHPHHYDWWICETAESITTKAHKESHCNENVVFESHYDIATGKDICEHIVVKEWLSRHLKAISYFKHFLLGALLSVHLVDWQYPRTSLANLTAVESHCFSCDSSHQGKCLTNVFNSI